jgi:DNA topoisomerase-1
VTLIAEKVAKGPSKRRFGADPGRLLGDHPQKGGPIAVKKGRYGPYVSHNGVNATIPDVQDPATITLEDAVALLDARAGKSADKPSPRRAAGRKSPTAAKKAAAKPAAKDKAAVKAKAAAKPAPKAKAKAIGKAKAAR